MLVGFQFYDRTPYSRIGNIIQVEIEVHAETGKYNIQCKLDVSKQLEQFQDSIPLVFHNKERDGLVFQSSVFTYRVPLAMFVKQIRSYLHVEAKSLFVEYIGQSKRGLNGTGSIADRLRNHEKLLQISMNLSRENSHREISIVLLRLEFNHWNIMMMGNLSFLGLPSSNKEIDHTKFMTNALPANDIINLAEAILINTFKPTYNEKFAKNLVRNNLKVLQRVRNDQYTGINVELDIEESGFLITSSSVSPSGTHHLNRNIESSENDKELFSFRSR